jgi:hypothetical protein
MTIFAILMPAPQPRLAEQIKITFPNDHLAINDTQWLVSATGTAVDLSAKLGVVDPRNPGTAASGNAIIFATPSYHGRAPTPVWDWIKAKLEAPPSV